MTPPELGFQNAGDPVAAGPSPSPSAVWLEAGGHDGGGGAAVVIICVGSQLPGWSTASEHLNINLVNAQYCE